MSNTRDTDGIFAARLREAREARELSQSELARRLGMQPSAIAHFEGDRRKPSFANVRAIAKALEVSSDYLLGRSATMAGATTAFRNEERLSAEDREWIQQMIDLRAKGKDAPQDE